MPTTVKSPRRKKGAVSKGKKGAKRQQKKEKATNGEETIRSRGKFNGLNVSQIKALEALRGAKAMTRSELTDATGIKKGWSKNLGTKAGTHEDSLASLNYVKITLPQEGERQLKYSITATGKSALAKALKEMAKAGKAL